MDHQQVMRVIDNPEKAENYLLGYLKPQDDYLTFKKDEYMASFAVIHKKRFDDCDGGAFAAAALLQDDGYPPLILGMYSFEKNGHAIYVYKKNNKWGTLGIDRIDCHRAEYDSIEDIVMSYGYDFYFLLDLNELKIDWINTDKDISDDFYAVYKKLHKVDYSFKFRFYRNFYFKDFFWWFL